MDSRRRRQRRGRGITGQRIAVAKRVGHAGNSSSYDAIIINVGLPLSPQFLCHCFYAAVFYDTAARPPPATQAGAIRWRRAEMLVRTTFGQVHEISVVRTTV